MCTLFYIPRARGNRPLQARSGGRHPSEFPDPFPSDRPLPGQGPGHLQQLSAEALEPARISSQVFVIEEQVSNGVAVRMALLYQLCAGRR